MKSRMKYKVEAEHGNILLFGMECPAITHSLVKSQI
jgi:hypothetical protein